MELIDKEDFILYGVKLAQDAYLDGRSFSLAFSDHKELGFRCNILKGIKLTHSNHDSSYRILLHTLNIDTTRVKLDSKTLSDYPYQQYISHSIQKLAIDIRNILSTTQNLQIDILSRQELLSRRDGATAHNRKILITNIENIIGQSIITIADCPVPLTVIQKMRLHILFALETARLVMLEEIDTDEAVIRSFTKLYKVIYSR